MIRLNTILSERHKSTPTERISKYKERIKNIQDKINKAEDKSSDTVKLQKNKIKVIQQTMNNYKQTQALKKAKTSETKLSEILKEGVFETILINIAVSAAFWAIKQAILSFRNTSVKEKEIGKAYIKWLDRLDKNDKFNKFVYYTLKNDTKLNNLKKELETAKGYKEKSLSWDTFQYEKSLVKKWLTSKPAEDELDKVFKDLYPNKDTNSRDIEGDNGMILTYKQWRLSTLNKAIAEFTQVLNRGQVKGFINQYAEKQGLETI